MAAANGISDVPDFFSPYADQLRSSIEALRRHLSQVENDEIQYKALQDTLQTYPRALTRTAVVRVGPRAIVRAHVNHTNEIYSSIGDGYVVQQSAFNAAEMAGRKLESLQNGKKQIETQIEDLERKLSQIEVITQPDQLVLDEESGLPFMEIREELDEDGNVIESNVTPQSTTGLEDFADGKFEEILKILNSKDRQVSAADSKINSDEASKKRPNGGLTASAQKSTTTDTSTVSQPAVQSSTDFTSTPEVAKPVKINNGSQSSSSKGKQTLLNTAEPQKDVKSSKPVGDSTKSMPRAFSEKATAPKASKIKEVEPSKPKRSSISAFRSKNYGSSSASSSSTPPSENSASTAASTQGGSRISNDMFELERIAQDLDAGLEDDFEDSDILDVEISDGSLSWKLAEEDDFEDENSDFEDSDYDDDEDESEDEFGRTRGTFFPWLPRGTNTPIQVLRPVGSKVQSDIVEIEPQPVLQTQPPTKPSVPSESISEAPVADIIERNRVSSDKISEVEPVKQVRFAESVAVQNFHSGAPSSRIENGLSLSVEGNSRTSLVDLKPEHDSEADAKPVKMSRFKMARQKSLAGQQAGSGNYFDLLNEDLADVDESSSSSLSSKQADVFGDVMEREPTPVLPATNGKSKAKGVTGPNTSSVPSVFGDVMERTAPEPAQSVIPTVKNSTTTSGQSRPKEIVSGVKERVSPAPTTDKPPNSARPSPPQPTTKSGNSPSGSPSSAPKPVKIGRPIPKRTLAPQQIAEPIDVAKLIEENVVPGVNAADLREPDEDEDEPEEEPKRPLLAESVIEREFKPPTSNGPKKKQSLFKKNRQESKTSVPSDKPLPTATNDAEENDRLAEEIDLDEDIDIDPDIHQQEISVAYHRLRQKMIDKQNGYSIKPEEREFVPLDENGEVLKVSRFMSARLTDRT